MRYGVSVGAGRKCAIRGEGVQVPSRPEEATTPEDIKPRRDVSSARWTGGRSARELAREMSMRSWA